MSSLSSWCIYVLLHWNMDKNTITLDPFQRDQLFAWGVSRDARFCGDFAGQVDEMKVD